jgi:hypothetical protein
MRQSYHLPQDDGSPRSQCPPSHHEMALTPYYAQASVRAPWPSPPLTHSPVSPGKVSPHHQQGSKTPWAAPPAPLARADPPKYGDPPGRSVGLMAPSPMPFEASMPSYSPHSSVSFRSVGGEYTPTAWPTPPSDEVTRSSRLTSSARSTRQLALGLMAPSPLNHQVKSSSTGMTSPPPPACLTKTMSPQRTLSLSSPSQPSLNRGGSKPGRASHCHHPPVLETAPLALPLVRPAG